jgi:glucokinase
MRYYIGLDLGGTAIKGGVIDEQMKVIASRAIPTEADRGADHVIGRLAELARTVAAEAKLKDGDIGGVGVGTPGPVDPKTQLVLLAPNLGWVNVPLGPDLAKKIGWPVQVVNDANAAGYGEFICGAARDVSDMVLLTLGTGIGSGIVIDGKLFIDPHGAGAELGHSIVHLHGRPCGCGQRGCLEQYASATAIAREAKRRREAGEKTTLSASPTTKEIFSAAMGGDVLADAVIDEACDYLGAAIVTIIHALDPQMVVLGGGVTAAGDFLLNRVRNKFKSHCWKAAPYYVRIELATLGNDAGFIGAAALAKEARP